jgi:Pyruvate/2-oxoacid:ferredoxin oxidoreductase gamma subunit
VDYSIKISGEAGQGIRTIGDTLARVFSRSGLHVFAHQDYESRIRGGHNFVQIRFSDRQVMAPREVIDILVALDKDRIPIGIIYRNHRPILEERIPVIKDKLLLRQSIGISRLEDTLKEFY